MSKPQSDQQPDYIDSHLLQEAVDQLLEQISKRDQKINWINRERTVELQLLMAEKAEREALLLDTQNQLMSRLMEKESQLNEILSSETWKMALFFGRVGLYLFPPNSRRAGILRRGLNMLLFKKTGEN